MHFQIWWLSTKRKKAYHFLMKWRATTMMLEGLAVAGHPRVLGDLLVNGVSMKGQSMKLGVRSLETFSYNTGSLLCLEEKSWMFSIGHSLVLADYPVPTHHALYPSGKLQGRYLSRTFLALGKSVLSCFSSVTDTIRLETKALKQPLRFQVSGVPKRLPDTS